jgi:hypothetical protein
MSLPNLLGLWTGFETNSTRGPTDQVLSPEDGGGANFERLWFIKTPKQWIGYVGAISVTGLFSSS